jgi:hypothetical protein
LLSSYIPTCTATPRLGTLEYMAPELLRCNPAARNRLRLEGEAGYGPKVDCWAIGCLAFESLVGQTPLEGAGSMEKALAFMETGRLREEKILPWLQDASDDAKNFILGCLDVEPSSRLTAQEMLCHPWIAKHHPHLSIPTTTVPDPMFDSVTSAADYMPPPTSRRSRERSERAAGANELQAATEGQAQASFANQHRWSSMPSGMSLAGDVNVGMLNLSNKFTTTSAGEPYAIHDPHSNHNLMRAPSPSVIFPSRPPSPMTVIGEGSTRLGELAPRAVLPGSPGSSGSGSSGSGAGGRSPSRGGGGRGARGDFHIPSPGVRVPSSVIPGFATSSGTPPGGSSPQGSPSPPKGRKGSGGFLGMRFSATRAVLGRVQELVTGGRGKEQRKEHEAADKAAGEKTTGFPQSSPSRRR